MTDFLLELRSEEIPARMQDKAREDLRWAFETEIRQEGGLLQGAVRTFATPRRLVLIARGLADQTEAELEELKGPRVGAPEQAIAGFLKKTGAQASDLFEQADAKGTLTHYVQIHKPSRSTIDVLATIIPRIVRGFPWPKSMRWGDASASTESLRWVRPLHGIVALFGSEVVHTEIAGIASGRTTVGHRFHSSGAIEIVSPADYAEQLRAAHVVLDQDERRTLIRTRAAALAAEAGLVLVEDEGLVAENAGLTEWPVPLLGRFDAAYLDVPPEVIQLTARVNQKYFVCRDADGALANAFVCTANIDATDGGAKIVEGNRKVLAARLSDARFFYDTDLKVPLAEQAEKLDKIVFHEKLGTLAAKVDRVTKLARWLVEQGIVTANSSPERGGGPRSGGGAATSAAAAGLPLHHPADGPPPRVGEDLASQAERAARLCKADLVTGMVGEFPELQGLMGGYYARAQGEDPAVADAIRDHYKPVGQGDDVPTAPVTVAVSLADKLDTLFSFFAVDERPTGSKDPFALRRAALGILAIQTQQRLRWSVAALYETWIEVTGRDRPSSIGGLEHLRYFFADRLKVQQREAGVRHDLIDAVFALGNEDDLVRLLARVHALQAFVGTPDGASLLAGYKRAANILKKEGYDASRAPADAGAQGQAALGNPGLLPAQAHGTPEPAEFALQTALDAAEPTAAAAIAREDFAAAMAALASLRAPIDAFFDAVTVNDPDPAKRASRLALLARVRTAVHGVADFSRVEG